MISMTFANHRYYSQWFIFKINKMVDKNAKMFFAFLVILIYRRASRNGSLTTTVLEPKAEPTMDPQKSNRSSFYKFPSFST